MIELNTLGDATIRIGQREIRPTSPAVFAALLYLGVERGRKVPRTALQELLFPATDERSGAHSLRQLLYKLRQLGASIQAEGDVVWLAAEDVSDDYSAPVHADGNGTSDGHSTGPFLYGYAPRLSPAFNEWLEAQRAAVEVNRRRALIKLMLGRRDAADWPGVERFAQEVLTSDPFNEEATLALAESTALAGSKSEAIRILERYESETGRADLKLPAQVLRRRISERLPDRRRRALDTPFVGREAEAQAMREAIVQLRAGQGGSIVISGEPGIGKTRLIEETTALALLEGVNVHVVRCQPHYVNRPMGVFIEWVPILMESRGALGVDPSTLRQLKLLTRHQDDPLGRPSEATDDATRSGILIAAIRELVDAVASEAPIMLAVEDAHWADQTSLRELCVLLDRRGNRALQVVFTARVIDSLAVAGVAPDVARIIRLKPLADGPMRALSRHLVPFAPAIEPAGDVVDWIARTASGNPFYLQALCAHFEETRQPFSVPPSIRVATISRIEQQPPESRRFLEFAALLDRHATLAALRSLTDLTPSAFLRTVQSLEEGGFLRTNGVAARPSHDFIRECALDLVPPITRQLLHASVAEHLEKQYSVTEDTSLLWDCTDHWTLSGDSAKAFQFLLRCAQHVGDIGHAAQAVELLSRAKRLSLPPRDRRLLAEQTSRMAKAARQWNLVLEAEAELQSSAPGGGHQHSDSELRAIEGRWALSLANSGLATLLSCARAASAPAGHRVTAAYLAVRIAHDSGDIPLAHDAYAAVAMIDRSSPIAEEFDLLELVYHTSFGDTDKAIRRANSIYSELGALDVATQLRRARNLGVAFCFLGSPAKSFAILAHYFEIASRLGLVHWQFDLTTCCYHALLVEDRVDEAAKWFDVGESIRNQNRWITPGLLAAHILAGTEIAILQGRRSSAERLFAELRALDVGMSVRARINVGEMAVRIAQLDPDSQCSDDVIADLKEALRIGIPLMCADGVVVALAEALRRRGRHAEVSLALADYLASRRKHTHLPKRLLLLAVQHGFSPDTLEPPATNG